MNFAVVRNFLKNQKDFHLNSIMSITVTKSKNSSSLKSENRLSSKFFSLEHQNSDGLSKSHIFSTN